LVIHKNFKALFSLELQMENRPMEDKHWTPKIIEALKNKSYLKEKGAITEGRIYRLDSNTVAKRGNDEGIHNEYFWGKFGQKNEVQVMPICKIVGLESQLNELMPSIDDSWFMVSKIIRGEKINYIYDQIKNGNKKHALEYSRIFDESTKQLKGELKKLLDLGVYPEDACYGDNLIFSNSVGKLYLLDYEHWRIGTKAELDRLYKKIKEPFVSFSGLSYG
jgi:hypothetical protein